MRPFDTIRSAWHRFAALWRPMASWTVLTWLLVVLPVAPLSSFILGWSGLRGSRAVVGNEELLAWGTTLPGLVWLLLAGGFALLAGVIRYAGIFHIITDDLENRTPGLGQTLLDLAPRVARLFRLCVYTAAAAAALALPFLAGLLGIKALFLGQYDINYYLATRPTEWTRALLAAGAWLVVAGVPVAWVTARSVLALPAYLDGYTPLRSALAESWARTRGELGRVVWTLGAAVVLWLGARAATAAAFVALGTLAVDSVDALATSVQPLLLATGAYVLGLVLLDAALEFTGFAFLSTVLTKAYHENTDLHTRAPAVSLAAVPERALAGIQWAARPRVAVPAAVVILAASAAASAVILEQTQELDPITVTAHRGGPPPAPENTLAALERAIDAGADWAEIDVQRTADDSVVVVHDADLMRMAGDPRRVRDTPYHELAGLVQHPDDGSPPAERRVATLGQLLERSEDRIGLLIELKYYGDDPGLVDAVLRDVRRAGMSGEVRIMSLNYPAVREVQRKAPRMSDGYATAASVGEISRLPVEFLAVNQTRIDARLVRSARARGIEIHAWTVNEPAQVADLMERGVHGVITDDPAMARRVSDEMVELSPAARLLLRFRDLWDDEDAAPL